MERRLSFIKSHRWLLTLFLLSISLSTCAERNTVLPPVCNPELLFFDSADVQSGKRISLKSLVEERRFVFLNFWGITCIPCIEEIEELNRLYEEKYREGRVVFVAVNTDRMDGKELKKKIVENNIHIVFPVIADPDMEITNFYSDGFVPHNVIISPTGEREIEVTGFNPELFKKLEKKLFELTRER